MMQFIFILFVKKIILTLRMKIDLKQYKNDFEILFKIVY
jgi:hypothetical protein